MSSSWLEKPLSGLRGEEAGRPGRRLSESSLGEVPGTHQRGTERLGCNYLVDCR